MDEQILDHVLEACTDALWADATRDPCEIADEAEHSLIESFGCNLAGKSITSKEYA